MTRHPRSFFQALFQSRPVAAAVSLPALLAALPVHAQEPQPTQLPPVEVTTEVKAKPKPAKKKAKPKGGPASKAASQPAASTLPAGQPLSAPPAEISQAPGDADGGLSSGGVNGYLATKTSTATKTDTPLRDVPQAVSVLTKERAQDQHATDLKGALQYVPGVTVAQGEGNRDQIVIRGQNTTADFFTDGVRDDVQYYRDLYNIDRVEVLKGPNAMIFGRGGGGGVVNRVTKKAGESVREVTASTGSFGEKRTALDIGERVSGGFAFRLNGLYEHSGSFRDDVDLERYGITPTLFFKPLDGTRLWLSYEHFNDNRTADRGLPSLAGRPAPSSIRTFFGDPASSYADFKGGVGTATLEHKFNEAVKIRSHVLYGDYDKFYQNVFAGGAVGADNRPGEVKLSAYNNTLLRESLFSQTDVTWTADTGFAKNTVLVGTGLGQQNTHSFRSDGRFGSPAGSSSLYVPFSSPNLETPVFFATRATDNTTRLDLAAAYLQDQLDFGPLQFIGGVRFDRFDISAENRITGADFGRTDNVFSPRAGVVFKPWEPLSFYLSYARSFLPYSGDQFTSLNQGSAGLAPEEFTNREAGFKWEITPRLAFTAAIYQLDRENTRVADPNNPGFFIQTGKSRTEGGEVEITGQVTDTWQIAAGYARTFGIITSATEGAPAGRHLPLVPANQFTLWNKVQLTPDWGIGLGLIHRDEVYASLSNAVILPSFTRADGAVYYKISDHVQLQLNVENISGEKYYATAHNDNNISPGAPRAFYVGIKSSY